jgi:hypothetical protein
MKRQELVLKWLNKEFGNLTPVVKGDKTYYVDKDQNPLFFYYPDGKFRYVYINYDRLWVFFESIFGLKDSQILDILKVWLEENYNIERFTPQWATSYLFDLLSETYNLRGVTPL